MTIRVAQVSEKVAQSRIVNGVIVLGEKNPAYGSIMFEEVAFTNAGGFLNKQKRVAFLRSDVETLKDYASSLNLKAGTVIPGKIVVEESITPFFEGQTPKVNPTSGETITHGGNAVYRNSSIGTLDQADKLLASDKIEVEITSEAEVLAAMKI